jgi:hypothetical protein
MPCKLQAPPAGSMVDFIGQAGQPTTVFAASSTNSGVVINAASLGDQIIPVVGGRATFTPVAGRNQLTLNFVGPDPTEVFEIREDCGGTANKLSDWRLQPGPAGEPGGVIRRFQIHAN